MDSKGNKKKVWNHFIRSLNTAKVREPTLKVCLVVPEGDPTFNDEWRKQYHILLLIICKTEDNSSEQNIPWQHGSRQKQRRFVGTTGGVWGWSDLGPMVSIVWEGGPAVRGKTIRAQIIWGLCQCPAYPFASSPFLSLAYSSQQVYCYDLCHWV